ncbi:DUF1441 family protein [Escherichia coli]|uniref:DUF1441 family protein n=1 Tax=Escherichia coli TaxID=562 RepID=UPI001F11415D|nr:DUF1441 family protein [Escherichia coli]UMR99272.1 terminase [Escherichia coli]
MDGELKNMKLNINQLAALSGLHRQTVTTRMADVPLAPGSNEKKKLYLLTDLITSLLAKTPSSEDEEMNPHDRKAWYQSERERVQLEKDIIQLVPVSDVRRSFSVVVKAIVQVLETWPDRLERDRGWTASQLNEVQIVVDEIRDTLEKAVIDCCDEADM